MLQQNKKEPSKIQELAYECKVEEAMSSKLVTVRPDDKISNVRKLLRDGGFSGLPVVENEKLVGIISIDNLIKCLMKGGINEKVRDNMTAKVKIIYGDEPLVQAINKFDKLGFGRFPVLDRDSERLIGIMTKGDIIQYLLKKLENNLLDKEKYKYRASHIFEDMQSDGTSIILRYIIKGGDYKRAGEQSGNIKKNLLKLGIPPGITRRIAIASCEAEMNIIIFAENGGELLVTVDEKTVRVNAIDRGPGIADIAKAMQPGYSTAPDWVREMGFGAGMGIPNIKNCSDEIKIDSVVGEGTNFEFIVNIDEHISNIQNQNIA